MESKSKPSILSCFALILSAIFSIVLYIIPLGTWSPFFQGFFQFMRVFFLFMALFLIFERLFSFKIYTKIFIGLLLGVIAGILLQEQMVDIQPIGTAFIRLIRMVIIPLVFASLLIGTASMEPKKMGRVGLKTLFYPFLPFSSQKVHEYLGFEGKVEEHGWEPHPPEPGQKLREPKPLFTKLDEGIIEEETSRIGT